MEYVAPILFLSSHIGIGDFRRIASCSRLLRDSILLDTLCWSVAGKLGGWKRRVCNYKQYDTLRGKRKCCRECGRARGRPCRITKRDNSDGLHAVYAVYVCVQCAHSRGGYSQMLTRKQIKAGVADLADAGCKHISLTRTMRTLSMCKRSRNGAYMYWRSSVEEEAMARESQESVRLIAKSIFKHS